MCGIAGFYNISSNFGETELVLMNNKLSHRGPNSEGKFLIDNIGLSHRRLSVIDLSENANQPMTSACGNYVICYNGEVYNFKELSLKHKLTLKTNSDTEVILELYAKLGVHFIDELNGMFAFSIYNIKNQELLLFRDRMGIKPLFYIKNDAFFAFASELKALTSVSEIKTSLTIDKSAVKDFLHLGFIPQPKTIYNEIQKFPAGCYSFLKNNIFEIKRYYSIENHIKKDVILDEKGAKKQLNNLLNNSIQSQLISDVPFGTFLSGGVDSSLVTAIAQAQSEIPINTFSIGFQEKEKDERIYARKVSNHLKTNHHELLATEQDGLELVEELLSNYDEPFADSSAIPTMLVSKLAKKHVTVTLSGDGGDELFHGYGAYKWAESLANPFIFNLKKIPETLLSSSPDNRHKRAALLFKDLTNANFHSHIFSQEQYLFSQNEIDKLLNFEEGVQNFNYETPKVSRKLLASEKQALFDLQYYLQDDLLVKVDRASMAYSLETRVPLLDHNIVEFALNLSPKLKTNNSESKYLLKQVLYDYVPKSFFERPKQGFSVPLAKWLKNELNYLIDKHLSEEAIKNTGLLHYSEVEKLKNDFKNGKDYFYNRIWALIVLQLFLIKHSQTTIDNK